MEEEKGPEEGVAQAKFEDGSASLLQRQEKEEPEENEEEEKPEPVQAKRAGESIVQRLEDEEKENEEDEEQSTIQQKAVLTGAPSVAPSLGSRIRSLRGGGQPLPSPVQAFFEPRFGSDFSQVRVHTDAHAAGTAKALNAKAFTVGRDVVFGAGQYEPASSKGRRLLAHELTHVVQQNSVLQSQITPVVGYGGWIQKKDPVNSSESREEQLRRKYPFGSLLWHYRRRHVTSRQIQGTWQFIHLRRVLHADYTEAIKACKLILKDISTDDRSKWNRPVKYYLRQVRKQAGLDKYNLNTRFVDKYHPEWSWKNIKPDEQTDELATRKQKRTVTRDFNFYLEEGAKLLGQAQFGLSAGDAKGPDPADSYDASTWREDTKRRGVIKARVSPWDAMNKLVRDIGKEVPKAGGGKTRWRFDCFEFVPLIRVYAYWRTMTKKQFNARFKPLELGFNSNVKLRWKAKMPRSEKPGEAPFVYKEDSSGELVLVPKGKKGSLDFIPVKEPIGKTWAQLVREAPVGSQVTWTNDDAAKRCAADSKLSFCAYINENTTKLGVDRYSAHPFGIVNEGSIKQRMANAVFGAGRVPRGYIDKNIYISLLRYPIR